METIYCIRVGEVKKNKASLEKKLGVKLSIVGGRVQVVGGSLDEFTATQVLDAISFGFSARKAVRLVEEDFIFRTVHIKEFTKRSLKDIRSRLIGTRGKTRKTISEISGCDVMIKESEVGIIGYVEDVDNVVTAITHIIMGTKQSNMYKYLEKMNRVRKGNDFVE